VPAPSPRSGLWLAAVAAVLFSAKAILAKLLFRYGLDAVSVLALRMLFSLPVFAAVAVLETARARGRRNRLSRRQAWLVVLLGLLGYYLSSFLDFLGLQYISAALERLILFLNPTLVLLFGMAFLGQKVARRDWLAMGVSYAGILLVFFEGVRVGGAHVLLGSGLVLAAAVSYALYLLLSARLVASVGSLRLVAYAMCVSTVAGLLQFAVTRPLSALVLPWPAYGLSALNALFCTVVPVYLTMFAVARVGAGATAQTSMLGPVSLLFLGRWVLDEPITPVQLAGTAVVLAGVWLLTRRPVASA
jgi:drug/metabolite transporter (DMT)-like permease